MFASLVPLLPLPGVRIFWTSLETTAWRIYRRSDQGVTGLLAGGGEIVCITLHLLHAAGYYTDRRRCGTRTAQLGVSRTLRAPRALCVAQDRKNPPALSSMEYL